MDDVIEIFSVLDCSNELATMMIIKYLEKAGNRKVYISEIVEELRLDIEQVKEIMDKLKNKE